MNVAGDNPIAPAAAEGGNTNNNEGDDVNFPAPLEYAHWRALGMKRKLALDMVTFQCDLLRDGANYVKSMTAQPHIEDNDLSGRRMGFVEGSYASLKFRAMSKGPPPARKVYIHHFDELTPHWEHVSNAITTSPRQNFWEVIFDKIELPRTVMDILGTSLAMKNIIQLSLTYNNLDYMSLTNYYLETNPNLNELKIIGNPLEDVPTALQFAEAIGNSEHIQKLEMKQCRLGKNELPQIMLPHLKFLKNLNLGYNDITSKDIPSIADFIASNPEAKYLNFSGNEFCDDDAKTLADALVKNSNLEHFSISSTDMTDKGRKIIKIINSVKEKRKVKIVCDNLASDCSRLEYDSPKLLPYEFWRSNGYDRELSQAMVSFQNNLHGLISPQSVIMPKTGEKSKFVTWKAEVDIDAYHMQKCPFISQHDSLLPKWKCALAGFEKDKSGNAIEKVRIKRVELVKDVMDILGNALVARNSIVHLALVNNKLDREGYLSLSAFLKKNSPLKTLQLEGNPIYDVACAQCLSEAVISHPSLDELKVDDCGLGRNIEILSAIANTMEGVSLLSLNSNDIDNSGAAAICNVLSTNPSHLTKLMVTSNEFIDEGATFFAEALRTNTNLKDLLLRGNDITETGEIVLRKAFFNDTSLTTLFNSNHTCKVQGLGHISAENSTNFRNTIKKKMSTAMFGCFTHGKDSKVTDTRTVAMNMHLFADCPVELMPVELSFINRCSNFNDTKKPCLSNMYEVVRNWDVPVMFAYAVGAVAPPEKKRRRKRGGRTNIIAKKAKTC